MVRYISGNCLCCCHYNGSLAHSACSHCNVLLFAISSAAEYNIQKISTLIVRRIRSYDINKDRETKLLNELENHFNIAKRK